MSCSGRFLRGEPALAITGRSQSRRALSSANGNMPRGQKDFRRVPVAAEGDD
jgi:hypothetical protein